MRQCTSRIPIYHSHKCKFNVVRTIFLDSILKNYCGGLILLRLYCLVKQSNSALITPKNPPSVCPDFFAGHTDFFAGHTNFLAGHTDFLAGHTDFLVGHTNFPAGHTADNFGHPKIFKVKGLFPFFSQKLLFEKVLHLILN